MIGVDVTIPVPRAARAARGWLVQLTGTVALSLFVGCASDAPPPPAPALEVLRTTGEDGSVRYTLKRNPTGAAAGPERATGPADAEPSAPPSSEGDEQPDGPGEQIRGQVENDREFLREIISRSAPVGFERSQDPKLREIAERLPRLQAELEALENEPEP